MQRYFADVSNHETTAIKKAVEIHCPLLHHSTKCNRIRIVLREFFATDVQRIECIRAVGTMFEEVFLRLWLFLHRLVLSESESAPFDTSRLNSEDKIIVILSVEERHEPLLSDERLVDEQIFLIMPHRITEVHVGDLPSVPLKLMNDHIAEVLVVHRIV